MTEATDSADEPRAEVYRAFDAIGRLLYVGCSVDVDARIRQHTDTSLWWPFHERIEREPFATRELAAEAEAEAIATEHPRWNISGRSLDHPDGHCTTIGGARWLDYERDVARRYRDLRRQESSLLSQLRKVRFALAGARSEADGISRGVSFYDADEEIA